MKILRASVFYLTSLTCLISISAQAQIIPDNSLGAESSVVIPLDAQGTATDLIDGGAARGASLFHSFQEFNVNPDRGAFFNNPEGINNIFSRVTGTNISNINGLLGVAGGANLFLINPNGIVFGENAGFNIQGSFFASSADSLLFDNNLEFSGSNPQAPPLLEISIPIGLNFRDNPGDIINQSPALALFPSQTLALVGGNVSFDGGVAFAGGGNIKLGGLAEAGVIELDSDLNLTFPDNVSRGDVLINNSFVSVSGADGGSININARNIELIGSNVSGGIASDMGSVDARGGDIIINATGDVLLDEAQGQSSTISNSVFGIGNTGNVEIIANNVSFLNGSSILSSSNGQGDIGDIILTAGGDITFDGTGIGGIRSGVLSSSNNTEATENVSNVNITAENLSITNGSQITSFRSGVANSGNINLDIVNSIDINGFAPELISADGTPLSLVSEISSQVVTGIGDAGDININTQNLALSQNGQINTSSVGGANGSDININASVVSIDGSGNENIPSSNIRSGILGGASDSEELETTAGDINITTNSLSIANSGNLDASVDGIGNGGNITIDARDSVEIVNGLVQSNIFPASVGDSGDLEINTSQLTLSDRTIVSANIFGTGDAGNIIINATDSVDISSGILQANIFDDAVGNGGSIDINTARLSLSDVGFIGANIFGTGDAGNIEIDATESVVVSGNSPIVANISPGGTGNGGSVAIATGNLSFTEDSVLSTSSQGEGNAGNITIEASDRVFADNILINSNVGSSDGINASGNVGSIQIDAREIIFTNTAQIQAGLLSGATGEPGTVNLSAIDSISFTGNNTGIFSNNADNSIGDASNAQLFAPTITLDNGAVIESTNFGRGNGGNVTIEADNLTLEGNSSISGSTVFGTGGIVILQIVEDLILGSGGNEISAQAVNDADGGNLTIDSELIIAFPGNNDIFASADLGNGGNININAESLFGIAERPLNPFTNDINASSEFGLQGNIDINNPAVDPTTGLINLPASVGDASDQISQNPCQQGVGSEFIVTGKGGLPPNVDRSLNSESVEVGLIDLVSSTSNKVEEQGSKGAKENIASESLPARGWVFNDSGEVTLVAHSNKSDRFNQNIQSDFNSCQNNY